MLIEYSQAEFSYKVKPKLPAQFKAAEMSGVPFAVILGEDEQAQGKVKIKELGLADDHPEKEGVLVLLADLVKEVKKRLRRKYQEGDIEDATTKANGLSLDGGTEVKTGDDGV